MEFVPAAGDPLPKGDPRIIPAFFEEVTLDASKPAPPAKPRTRAPRKRVAK